MNVYGYRARIGYTSPPVVTEVFPYEFYRIAPRGVTLGITSLAISNVTADEMKESMQISLRAAREMAKAGMNLVVLGGLPINLTVGLGNVDELIKRTEDDAGVPVTTSFTSQMQALRAVGARRVAMVKPGDAAGPYDFMEREGYEVVGSQGGGHPHATDWGKVAIDLSARIARELHARYPHADTIHYLCPHWATAANIDELEQELGINIITASQAITWHALRRCGIDDRITGWGRLLREC
jgi:maleate isomerase